MHIGSLDMASLAVPPFPVFMLSYANHLPALQEL